MFNNEWCVCVCVCLCVCVCEVEQLLANSSDLTVITISTVKRHLIFFFKYLFFTASECFFFHFFRIC